MLACPSFSPSSHFSFSTLLTHFLKLKLATCPGLSTWERCGQSVNCLHVCLIVHLHTCFLLLDGLNSFFADGYFCSLLGSSLLAPDSTDTHMSMTFGPLGSDSLAVHSPQIHGVWLPVTSPGGPLWPVSFFNGCSFQWDYASEDYSSQRRELRDFLGLHFAQSGRPSHPHSSAIHTTLTLCSSGLRDFLAHRIHSVLELAFLQIPFQCKFMTIIWNFQVYLLLYIIVTNCSHLYKTLLIIMPFV